MNKKQLEEM